MLILVIDLTKVDKQTLQKAIALFVEERKKYHEAINKLLGGRNLGELDEKEQLETLKRAEVNCEL